MSELKVHASVCESEPMVQSEEIKAAFVLRLKTALSQAGIPEWGAGARLAKRTEKTAKAASKWLSGESMPSRGNMLAIAEWLNVRAEWLAYGDGDMQAQPVSGSTTSEPAFNMAALQRLKGQATPRSVAALDRIEKAAQQGRLKEADLVLLEGIAARFEQLNTNQP